MRFYKALSLLLCSSGAFSAPTGLLHTRDSQDLAARGGEVGIAADIIEIATDLVKSIIDIVDLIKDIDEAQHAAEEQFTKGMVAQLVRTYPDKNVIVYHDQDSDASQLVNAVHSHYELDLPSSPDTQGYEILVFDSGPFHRAGDGGFINWSYAGYFTNSDDGEDVTFDTPPATTDTTTPPTTPPVPPTEPTRANSGDTDGNYFVNCLNSVDGTTSSGLAYYANLNPGQNVGQQPQDYQDVHHGGYYTWEQPGQITFASTGATVHWSVFGNAEQSEVNSASGTADNGYENFWVYKDAGSYLYSVDDWVCSSVYFAF